VGTFTLGGVAVVAKLLATTNPPPLLGEVVAAVTAAAAVAAVAPLFPNTNHSSSSHKCRRLKWSFQPRGLSNSLSGASLRS